LFAKAHDQSGFFAGTPDLRGYPAGVGCTFSTMTTVPDRLAREAAGTTLAGPPPISSIARLAPATSSEAVFWASSLPPTRTNGRHSSATTGIGARALAQATSKLSRSCGSRAASSARWLTTSTPWRPSRAVAWIRKDALRPSARAAQVRDQHQAVLDQVVRGTRDEPRPLLDHPSELDELRILH
jgi:hypothetical protein